MVFTLFTVFSMGDEESSSGATATVSLNTATSNPAAMHRPPLPQVKPPPPLNLAECSAKRWKLWKQTWLNFAIVSKISTQGEEYQKALFLCTIGQSALEIFNAFQFSASEDPNKVDTIITKFDEYFMGDVNETYERFKFNQRNQEAGESFDAYLTALRNMTESCNFCTCPVMSDSLIRDRIVLGIRNEDSRKRLLQERKLDLKKCIDICRTSESASTHLQAIGGKLEEVHWISKTNGPQNMTGRRTSRPEHLLDKSNSQPRKLKCKFCSKTHVMKKELCPAWGRRCSVCGKMNHWRGSEVCEKREKVHSVSQDSDFSDSDSEVAVVKTLDVVVNGVRSRKDKPIYCEMRINSKSVTLQVDCGATVCIIPKSHIGDNHIQSSNISLEMWNKAKMNALGTCKLLVENPKTLMKYMVKFVVVEEELTPLLSRKAAEKMNLITVNYDLFENVSSVVDNTDIFDGFPDIFNGDVGTFPGSVRLTLKPDAEPILRPPKRLPIELKEPVKLELDRLVDIGVLAPVDEPTDWVNQMAIATKKDGSLRICIDPRSLNLALKREHYQLPVLDDILPHLAKAKVFSKVDLSHGYWHCVLEEESSLLTTFSTPFGRYRWTRLPFGLSASSEIFQKRLIQALEGLVGVACIADDILIYGVGDTLDEATQDHDKNLSMLLERCCQKSIKLNRDKVVLRVQQIDFMGHLLTAQGLKPDPNKVEAILKLETPETKEDIERLNGTVNYLAKFLPRLSQVMEPLRRLTQSGVEWYWGNVEDKAFNEVKQLVTQAPILAYYCPEKELVIQCDASGLGLGAVLMQEGRPLAYASRALTDPETRYATIEKEMLAIVFALEKWHQFVYGRHVVIRTDHKPLESIAKKPLDRAPKRLQGMLLRSLAYDIDVQYTPGHTQHLADMMSRSFLPAHGQVASSEFETVNAVQFLPMRQERIQKIQLATAQDETLQLLMNTILKGWPEDRLKLSPQLTPYYSMRDELSIYDGLVFKGERLVVPQGLRAEIKQDIHASHAGVEGCLRRARESVYWPGMNSELRHWISTCEPCRMFEVSHGKETLMSHDIPQRPWEKVAVDLFTQDQKEYLVTVDYYSGYWELDKLCSTDSRTVVSKLKAHFARHGSPCQLISDNGPQFVAAEFQKLTKEWDIEHMVTSPYNSKANGKVEAAVKSAKKLLRKTAKGGDDFYLGLLAERNIPSQGVGSSPVQRLMNRRTRTLLPTTGPLLEPRTLNTSHEREKLKDVKKRQAQYYNANAHDLPQLSEGDTVRMKPFVLGQKEWKKGVVVERLDERSYEVETADGSSYRRNRAHLKKTNEPPPATANSESPQTPDQNMVLTQTANKLPLGTTLAEPLQMSSHPDELNEITLSKESDPKALPCIEPCKEQTGPDTRIRTRSGRLVTSPSYLRDFVV